ncbi:MAG: M28 family peptidase [Planctomycetes bacterium]|nr:M28 family peptidase [Planctomycetota bacterium]
MVETGPGRLCHVWVRIHAPDPMLRLAPILLLIAPQSTDLAPAPPVPALVSQVQGTRAAKTVRELVALGPRMGGTPSGERSAAYLEEALRALGLSTRRIEEKEQLVHWENSWDLKAVITPKEGGPSRAVDLPRTWPYGFSPRASGRARVSLGSNAGEVGLFESFHRPSRKGPALAVGLVDGYNTDPGDWPRLRPLRSTARNPYPVFGISAEAGGILRAALANGDSVELEYELDAHVESRPTISVEARLLPKEGAAPGFFLVCAHGDSDAGGPGANDNASGVAIVLEMARSWKAAIDAGSAKAPEREVRFVIWGSEFLSTRQYLDAVLANESEILLGVLNFDQAGFGAGADQLNVEPDDLASNRAFVHTACDVLNSHAGTPGFPKRWATNKSLGGTDSYTFSGSEMFRKQGLPAVTLFTSAWDKAEEHPRTKGMPGESWNERDRVGVDYDPYYHSAGDRPELTTDREPDNMVWCARVGLLTVARYLETLPD